MRRRVWITDDERAKLHDWLLNIVGQQSIDEEGYTYMELAKRAFNFLGFRVTAATIKKAMVKIGLRSAPQNSRRTLGALNARSKVRVVEKEPVAKVVEPVKQEVEVAVALLRELWPMVKVQVDKILLSFDAPQ